jgi:hypothetical protein
VALWTVCQPDCLDWTLPNYERTHSGVRSTEVIGKGERYSFLIPQGVVRRWGKSRWERKQNRRRYKELGARCGLFIQTRVWNLANAAVAVCVVSFALVRRAGRYGAESTAQVVIAGYVTQIGWARSLTGSEKKQLRAAGCGS